MAKVYHVNTADFSVELCDWSLRECPFGAEDDHFTSADAAEGKLETMLHDHKTADERTMLAILRKSGQVPTLTLTELLNDRRWTKGEHATLRLLLESVRALDVHDRSIIDPLLVKITRLRLADSHLPENELLMFRELDRIGELLLHRRK